MKSTVPHRSRRLLAAVAVGGLALTACTGSTPSDKRVAFDIVESMGEDVPGGELTDEQQQCMIDKIDTYSEAELEAIADQNVSLVTAGGADFAVDEGTPDLQAFVADLEECTGEPVGSDDTATTEAPTGSTVEGTATTAPVTAGG